MTTSPRPPTTIATAETVVAGTNTSDTQATALDVPAAAATVAATATHRDQVWGDFRFGELLGKGGMGAVYRGAQVSLDRPVAIKVLPAHLSDNESFRERFVIEARSVARINSPHVIQVYGAGVHQGHHFFAMELVEGQDLSKVLKTEGRPDHAQALDWVLQAARGLAAAGELGIIHRDIKPANLMLTQKGTVKVMDFGLARLASEGQGLTMTGTIMGTVSYFSPEQGRGERCDCRTDIYALGVTFYELLTGTLPFTGTEPTSIIYQHIHVEPKPPRALEATIPEDFQAVCLKCLQKSADQRYQTAADLARDLEAIANRRPPNLPSAELSALRKGLPLARKAIATAEGLPWGRISSLTLLAAAGIAGVTFVLRPAEPPPQTQTPTVVAEPVAAPPEAVAKPVVVAKPVAVAVPVTAIATPAAVKPVEVKPVEKPAATVPPPAPVAAVVTPVITPPAFDATPIQAQLDGSHFAEARAALAKAAAGHPGDPGIVSWGNIIDRAEGGDLLTQGRAALTRYDFAEAETKAKAAGTLLPTAQEPATLLADITRQRLVVETALQDAKSALSRGAPGEAEQLLSTALTQTPGHAGLTALQATARAERERLEDLARRAQARSDAGDLALAKQDADAALAAYSEALALVPGHAAATTGRDKATALQQGIASAKTRCEAAIGRRDVAAARAQIEVLTGLAPANPATIDARQQLAGLLQRLEDERLLAEKIERQRVESAKTLAIRCEDRRIPIPTLEQELAAFLTEAGQNRPERPALERRIEDRRQWSAVEDTVANLDKAVIARNAAAIAATVEDPDLRAGLTDLGHWSGLSVHSSIANFVRDGERATARLDLRHAFDVYPEQTLTYAIDLVRRRDGWVITAARVQEPSR